MMLHNTDSLLPVTAGGWFLMPAPRRVSVLGGPDDRADMGQTLAAVDDMVPGVLLRACL